MLCLFVYWVCTTIRFQILLKSNVDLHILNLAIHSQERSARIQAHLIFSTSACVVWHFLPVVIVTVVPKVWDPTVAIVVDVPNVRVPTTVFIGI